ncbi:MAG: GNAT family N-acetyltransferase [Actinomycetota bacterium]|nr:GNAT family N-acetyltransferase [Actinomycetota bacterium]
MIGIRECEQAQLAWFTARAAASGGRLWVDSEHTFAWLPDDRHVHLLFPERVDAAALGRGIAEATRLRATLGVWLGPGADPAALADAGFEHGWQPWWMVAELADVPRAEDERVRIEVDGTMRIALAWEGSRSFGKAVAHLGTPDVAGIFDMGVYPRWQRQGVGSALLSAVCRSAEAAGARFAALNATPDGERLYSRRGFVRVGDGETWWLHPR